MNLNTLAHILIVDDDPRICKFLSKYLEQEGYRVSIAGDGSTMRETIQKDPPDLVILDLLLPGENGLELTKELKQTSNIGIIIVTGKGDTIDKVVGLEVGADDYLPKPFDERELSARIRSVLRRISDNAEIVQEISQTVGRFQNWTLNFEANELLSSSGERVHLTSYEYQLLAAFVRKPNHVFSRDDIIKIITGRDQNPDNRSVDVLIGKLRKKLKNGSDNSDIIKTVRGSGYKFTAHVEFESVK